MPACRISLTLLLVVATTLAVDATAYAARTWQVAEGTATLSLDDAHLATLGLAVVSPRPTAASRAALELRLEPPLYSFAIEPGSLSFRTERGGFAGFVDAMPRVDAVGGLVFSAEDTRTRIARDPVYLYDFAIELAPGESYDFGRIVVADPVVPAPLDIRNAGFRFDETTGELSVQVADLQISYDWATALGQPHLAGQWVGSFDLRLTATSDDPRAALPPVESSGPGPIPQVDVILGQLYGLTSQGRIGTYPSGRNGMSAATTSCNAGNSRAAWHAPMAEDHPTIGLALFRRDPDGRLSMIGKNWMKHGFLALANNQCGFGCDGYGGDSLGVGCSDTYSAGNNGSRFYLGPRDEIDPLSAHWGACGSFFDATPMDCSRDYFGTEPNGVNHRLEVEDADLNVAGADFFYEGVYVVASDINVDNNIGWREANISWNGSSWSVNTVGGTLSPNNGPFINTWGDAHDDVKVPNDGRVILASKVTDLGGAQWRYDYLFYNLQSARGVRSLIVPTGGANVSSVQFRDVDQDGSNDWTSTVTVASDVTWQTDDFATDPNANALRYQSAYYFSFVADVGPVSGVVQAEAFEPGAGSTFQLAVQVPSGAPTSVLATVGEDRGFGITASEPNPFAGSTRVSFSLDRQRKIRLSVVDVNGRSVRVLVEGDAAAGSSNVTWDGRDASGSRVAAGVYFFRLESETDVRTLKATLLR